MRPFVRYLLWLLIVALPLQGGAAAFMSCGANASQIGATLHHVQHDGDDADGRSSVAVQEHCGSGDEDHAAGMHGKCSQCASCCLGAAAPPAMPADAAGVKSASSSVDTIEPAMTFYCPAALERPPRRGR